MWDFYSIYLVTANGKFVVAGKSTPPSLTFVVLREFLLFLFEKILYL